MPTNTRNAGVASRAHGRSNSKHRARVKGTPYHELGLDNPELTDDQLLDAMLAHPILINRPIIVIRWVSDCVGRRKPCLI